MAEQLYSKEFFSSPPQAGPNQEYTERTRAKIRGTFKHGMTKYRIIKRLGLPKSMVYDILRAQTSRRTRKGKEYRPYVLLKRTVRLIIRMITQNYIARCLLLTKIKAILYL